MKTLSGRQRWVKNAAIVFFIALLLLTFFSNTIMNHSLAEVSTQEVTSDTVSTKVRGTGTVEAGETTDVTLSESREITEVLVEEGDSVKVGDVLFRLKEGQSAELEEAAKELKDLKESYQHQILVNEIDAAIVQKAQSGGIDYTAATAELKRLSSAVDSAKANADAISKQLDIMNRGASAYDAQVTQATGELDQANAQLEAAENTFAAYGYDETELNEILNGYSDIPVDQNVLNAKAALDARNTAQALVNERTAALKNATDAQTAEQNRLSQASDDAQAALDAATQAHENYLSDINTIKDLQTQYESIQEKQTAYDKLAALAAGTEIKSEIDGKISGINVKKGEISAPDVPLCSILSNKNGFTLRFPVTKQQASKVRVGDVATISNSWYYSDVTATLKGIKNDTQNPGKSKVLVFDIQGDVEVGQSMTLSIGEKNASYDYVVPNSAVREDNNGKFILIIKEKSSPLGNRYVATRVDVEILASDDAKTAVKGALEGYEYVITTSSKLVNAGDYVRLAEN